MVEPYYIGLLGLALLTIGWSIETWKTIREKRSPVELKFSLIYGAGSLALMIYAYLLGDLIFTVLNFLTTAMALLNAYYKIKEKKLSKGKRK